MATETEHIDLQEENLVDKNIGADKKKPDKSDAKKVDGRSKFIT